MIDKKLLRLSVSMLLVVFISSIIALPVTNAADNFRYSEEVNILVKLDLYQPYIHAFDNPHGAYIDRQSALVRLYKFFGITEHLQITDAEADLVLDKYADKKDISVWSKKVIAHAVKKGILKGVSTKEIAPQGYLNEKMLCTLILRQLGYELKNGDYENAVTILKEKDSLSENEVKIFYNKNLICDDFVGILYDSINAKCPDNQRLIDKFINEYKIINKEKAIEEGLIDKEGSLIRYHSH